MRTIDLLTIGDKIIKVLNYIPACDNCGAPSDEELCSPCRYLSRAYVMRQWGDNEGLVNRRWQMYFNRGLLTESCPTTPRWETKRKLQTW